MGFKIGFTTVSEHEEKREIETIANLKEPQIINKSVVEVYFPDRNITCSYYNDLFNLKRGDIVYVEGKLEGVRGRVVETNYNFKIKLSEYKRVVGVANTAVAGEFYLAGSHFITTDKSCLPYEQAATWFKAADDDGEEYISSNGDDILGLVCNCYCTGSCKHEFATMLQLKDILAIIKNKYPAINHNEYLAAISKASFFEFVIDGNTKGMLAMGQ